MNSRHISQIKKYLIGLSFFVISQNPKCRMFEDRPYIFFPSHTKGSLVYADSWISPLTYIGWQKGWADLYHEMMPLAKRNIYDAEALNKGYDTELREAIIEAIGIEIKPTAQGAVT